MNLNLIKNLFSQQKTRLSASSLTEFNTSTHYLDLSIGTIPEKISIVKFSNVDPTGIEPANPDYSDPGVHQHQAHKFSIAGVQNLSKIARLASLAKRASLFLLATTIPLFIILPTPALAANIGQFTAEVWVKPTSSIASQAILGKAEELRIFTDSSGYAGCQIKVTSWQTAATATTNALTLNSWNHVACTYDKANIKVFVNGVQVATQAQTSAPDDTANAILLGQDSSASTPYSNLTGAVDNFQFYNYARTADQIVSDMNAGHPNVGSPVGSAVGYWKMDEGYGTTAYDTTPNANNLTLSSSSYTDSGKFNKAWNGTNAVWLSRADDDDFDFTAAESFTISGWFKSDSATNPAAVEYLVSKGPTSTAGYAIYANTDGTICFGIDDDVTWGPDVASCTTADFYDATWHYLTAIRDVTADTNYIYIDGISKDSDTDSTTATLANSATLYVGDLDGTNNGDEFTGDLDEIKVYRYALTAEQVKIDMNRGSAQVLGALSDNTSYQAQAANQEYCIPGDSTSCVAPVGRWDFEEGTGSSAYDTSGGGGTGTITGATYAVGKVGKALNFNGSTDAVTVSNSLSTKTVSFWVNPSTTTQNLIDLRTAATAANISVSSGTISATGFTSPTIYVNGAVSSTLAANSWQYVTITTGTAITANAISFGRISSTSLTGKLDSIRFFNYARTAAQVAWDYNRGAPVGHWKMDECQGDKVNDSSGNSNTGTITVGASGTYTSLGTCASSSASSMWYNGATGKYNYSLAFDGTDDYVVTASSPTVLNITGSITLSAFVKRSSTGTYDFIIAKDDTSSNRAYSLLIRDTNEVSCDFLGTTNNTVTSTRTITDTNWHLLTCTYDGTTQKVYIDGLLDGSTAATGSIISTTVPVYIGARNAALPFIGQIDDVKIFNYALTPTQVKGLYTGGAIRYGPVTGAT